jgi:hypothetical protein
MFMRIVNSSLHFRHKPSIKGAATFELSPSPCLRQRCATHSLAAGAIAPLQTAACKDRPLWLGSRVGAKDFENFVNNFRIGTIKANMLFGNSGRLCLATICRALEVDEIWPKGRPFSSEASERALLVAINTRW